MDDVADFLARLPLDVVVQHGGFYIYARAGQGIVVPPLFMMVYVNRGLICDGPPLRSGPDKDTVIADVTEAQLNSNSELGNCLFYSVLY